MTCPWYKGRVSKHAHPNISRITFSSTRYCLHKRHCTAIHTQIWGNSRIKTPLNGGWVRLWSLSSALWRIHTSTCTHTHTHTLSHTHTHTHTPRMVWSNAASLLGGLALVQRILSWNWIYRIPNPLPSLSHGNPFMRKTHPYRSIQPIFCTYDMQTSIFIIVFIQRTLHIKTHLNIFFKLHA